MLSQEQAERMRKATAIRVLKQMSLEEIDSTLQALKDDNDRLREALNYYATEGNYESGDAPGHIYIESDKGHTAREALK